VSYSAAANYYGVRLGCGTNFEGNSGDYWIPSVYTSPGVPTAPPNCDIIALNEGGLKTITFSQAVVNPLIAVVSWNGQLSTQFSGPIEVLSSGLGYWGIGTLSASGNTLSVIGEGHGVIRMLGTYTEISFTDVNEFWHGFTIGAQDVAAGVVPEPATYALLTGGLAVLAVVRRRRRTAA